VRQDVRADLLDRHRLVVHPDAGVALRALDDLPPDEAAHALDLFVGEPAADQALRRKDGASRRIGQLLPRLVPDDRRPVARERHDRWLRSMPVLRP
jgi:hypothetical protein